MDTLYFSTAVLTTARSFQRRRFVNKISLSLSLSLQLQQSRIKSSAQDLTTYFETQKQVGYGDLVPTSKASKLFTAFYAFYASIVAAIALGELVENHVKQAVKMLNSTRYFERLRASTLSILLFVVIASVGVLWFMVVEDFDLVDAVYFSIVSLSSVGFGDVTVQSSASKIFSYPFS